MKKVIIIIITAIVVLSIISCICIKFTYKKENTVHNISNKTLEECEKYILNIKSYTATIEMEVKSNKNINKYIINQSVNENESVQTVLKPENISGMKIIYKNGQLILENTDLNLKNIYENYKFVEKSGIFFSDFINNYKLKKVEDKVKIEENKDEIILKIELDDRYMYIEKLYVNKNTGKPSKLEIIDKSKKTNVYILYKEIELNNI